MTGHRGDSRAERDALILLADAFGTPDDPITVQYVRRHQPPEFAALLTETANQIARGHQRTRRWVTRVRKASARRASRAANTNQQKKR